MGYIYVISNSSMPGMLKIGCTDRSPEERIAELSSATGVPTPFILEMSIYVRDHSQAEKEIHRELVQHRVSNSREFFRLTLAEAIAFLRSRQIKSIIEDLKGWDETSIIKLIGIIEDQFLYTIPSHPPSPQQLDAVIKRFHAWNDESLMKLITMLESQYSVPSWTKRLLTNIKNNQNHAPTPQQLDAVIKKLHTWDDDSLMKLVDAIFMHRPPVRKVF
jgi:hypothetical protein